MLEAEIERVSLLRRLVLGFGDNVTSSSSNEEVGHWRCFVFFCRAHLNHVLNTGCYQLCITVTITWEQETVFPS